MRSMHIHTCPLCEATCGLTIDVEGERVVRVRGDVDDVFSRGFVCPKGLTIGDLHHDPDRLREPLVDGAPASWDEAWRAVAARLGRVISEHGRGALGLYLGNPNVHNLAGTLYAGAVAKAMGGPYVFSASTSDQMPKQVSAVWMFGDPLTIPIPDIDRTDLLVVLGADPLTSNGSLMTAPDMPRRLRRLRRRGGRLVVVDPRSSRTARAADLHLPIRPGTDALLLAAVAHTLLAEGRGRRPRPARQRPPGAARGPRRLLAGCRHRSDRYPGTGDPRPRPGPGVSAIGRRLRSDRHHHGKVRNAGLVAGRRRQHAHREPRSAGWRDVPAGTRRAGELVTHDPPAGTAVRAVRHRRARPARGVGELPTAALAEEILGGHLRGLITIAGNPALSVPDAERLDKALAGLDVLVCVDLYPTETARHADVVLPVPSPLERPHFDLAFTQLAVRNVANYSAPVFPPGPRPSGRPSPGWPGSSLPLRRTSIHSALIPTASTMRS